jgi:hypothetical protein
MALTLCGSLQSFYRTIPPAQLPETLRAAVQRLLETPWRTGRLDQNNAFTTALVLRAVGMLHKGGMLSDAEVESLQRVNPDDASAAIPVFRQFNGKTLEQIAESVTTAVPESLAVQKHPPTPSIAYWVVDAISLLGFDISDEAARRIAEWASNELRRHVSLVSASHHAMMDPIAMAMAACLCRLLRRMAPQHPSIRDQLSRGFPTDIELTSAIDDLFHLQNRAGVWEKYFPLFHYPESGPNHCWHFEVLEAVLQEFPELVRDEQKRAKIERSLTWLESNRLRWLGDSVVFAGWNAGGDLQALNTGQPESWPTGVVHMFLQRLAAALSFQIQELVLHKYRDRVQPAGKPSTRLWNQYLDCDLPTFPWPRNSVKGLVAAEILAPVRQAVEDYTSLLSTEEDGRVGPDFKLRGRRSGLLFGPPGTSKTSLAQAIAQWLGWTFIELSPSDFLKAGFAGIYDNVNEVFDDMMDLFGAVVLFDEMDALVQTRETGSAFPRGTEKSDILVHVQQAGSEVARELDVTQTLLTTTMLPKLLQLRKNGRVLFFMATNHENRFDPAIKRSGRLDLLIRMGPPRFWEKVRALRYPSDDDYWYRKDESADERVAVWNMFLDYTDDFQVERAIDCFTFGEMAALFDNIRREALAGENLMAGMTVVGLEGFQRMVMQWKESQITLSDGSEALKEFQNGISKIQ